MLQPPYRAAVIGRTGRGDYGHGLDVALLDQPKLSVVAVADEDSAGRAAAAKRLRVERDYADFREMLDREKPQVVVVGPRWLDGHSELITACAERGVLGVFCEKPMAPTLADCDAIVESCQQHHCKLAMAYQTRYSPRFERVRELIAGGTIGELIEIRGRGKEDRRGGGEDLMVLGTHLMDMARAVQGDASWCFARVGEAGRPIGPEQVRDGAEGIGPLAGDRVDAMYGFRGSPAVYHFGTSRPRQGGNTRFGIGFYGSTGCIWMGTGWKPPAFLLRDPSWNAVGRVRWEEITSGGVGQPETIASNDLGAGNRAIVTDLVHAIETDTQPRASGEDGRASIEMILACYASQVRGGPVDLPLSERSEHPLAALRRPAGGDS